MKKNHGFTLIELMIVVAILAILAAILFPVFFGSNDGIAEQNLQVGYNGTTETRCIDGFKFVVGYSGNAVQMMDQEGRGIPCNN